MQPLYYFTLSNARQVSLAKWRVLLLKGLNNPKFSSSQGLSQDLEFGNTSLEFGLELVNHFRWSTDMICSIIRLKDVNMTTSCPRAAYLMWPPNFQDGCPHANESSEDRKNFHPQLSLGIEIKFTVNIVKLKYRIVPELITKAFCFFDFFPESCDFFLHCKKTQKVSIIKKSEIMLETQHIWLKDVIQSVLHMRSLEALNIPFGNLYYINLILKTK